MPTQRLKPGGPDEIANKRKRQRKTATPPVKHYDLALPTELYDTLEEIADKKQTTIARVLRDFIHLGLQVMRTQEDKNTAFLYQEGDTIQRVLIM